jgi:hypothetical protein
MWEYGRDVKDNKRSLLLAALLLVLLAGAIPGPWGLLFAVLIPSWFFVAALVVVEVLLSVAPVETKQNPRLRVQSPRAPPIL